MWKIVASCQRLECFADSAVSLSVQSGDDHQVVRSGMSLLAIIVSRAGSDVSSDCRDDDVVHGGGAEQHPSSWRRQLWVNSTAEAIALCCFCEPANSVMVAAYTSSKSPVGIYIFFQIPCQRKSPRPPRRQSLYILDVYLANVGITFF